MFDETFARGALARCVLFEGVDLDAMDACLACLRVRRFRRDETVFHQGDPGDALHVIASGSVKVVLPSPDAGEPAILATLGPGDFFGELALLDGDPHSASVIALSRRRRWSWAARTSSGCSRPSRACGGHWSPRSPGTCGG